MIPQFARQGVDPEGNPVGEAPRPRQRGRQPQCGGLRRQLTDRQTRRYTRLMADMPWIISVDDHVVEPPNVWMDRLPKKYHDVGPRIVRAPMGEITFIAG